MSESIKSITLGENAPSTKGDIELPFDLKESSSGKQKLSAPSSKQLPDVPIEPAQDQENLAPPVPPKDTDTISINSGISQLSSSQPSSSNLKGQKFVLSGSETQVYVTHSPSKKYPKLVVLLTNSLGLGSENNLKLADIYSERLNCPVIVPDLFDGDPIRTSAVEVEAFMDHQENSHPKSSEDEEQEIGGTSASKTNWWSKLFTVSGLKHFAVNVGKGFVDEMWLARHTYEKTHPHLASVLSEIIQVYSPKSLGVIGYSYGGRYVLSLLEDSRNNEWSSDEDLITVGASVHPSLVEAKDFERVNKPFMLVYGKDDDLLQEDVVRSGTAYLRDQNVEFSSNVFEVSAHDGLVKSPKLPHGFAVPGDYPEDIVGDKPYQVINVVASWISEHL